MRQRIHRQRRKLYAIAGGAAFALAAPPTDLYPAVLVGLFALVVLAHQAETPLRGLGLGWLWGTAAHLVGMRFVPSVIQLFTPLGTAAAVAAHVLLSAAQALHWGACVGLAVWLHKRWRVPLEAAIGAGVLLALLLPSVFLWSPAGLMSPWPVLVQSAELIGERGLSVALAVLMALGYRAALAYRDEHKLGRAVAIPSGAALAIVVLLLAHGVWAFFGRYPSEVGGDVRVGLIHAGVDPRDRWQPKSWPRLLAVLKAQTAEAELGGVDLSVWPEAAYPYRLPHDSTRAPRQRRAIHGGAVQGPVLFGFIATARPVRRDDGTWERNSYNAATILDRAGNLQPSYDKMELLAFGETVPLGRYVPWLRRTFQRGGGLIPGSRLRRLELERDGKQTLRIGVLNCYEDTIPGLGRRIARELDPNLLVNVTNDAWFVGTVEPELHARLAVMRAIETRRDLVRAVNLGVSGWIDAAGRVRARSDDPSPGWLLATPKLRDGPPTIYVRFGDWPAVLVLLGVTVGFAWRRREEPRPES